ncbi:hypothetical protein OIU79_008548 [Salix purpurea]|uniref:Uncharacterized protein n=1 Tax=Salix purpurea TaxID=77065 RepID=A0A9Q0YW71_SALPP|nr:hypothetical protein OIU79_008548 [Salix purpurea]
METKKNSLLSFGSKSITSLSIPILLTIHNTAADVHQVTNNSTFHKFFPQKREYKRQNTPS